MPLFHRSINCSLFLLLGSHGLELDPSGRLELKIWSANISSGRPILIAGVVSWQKEYTSSSQMILQHAAPLWRQMNFLNWNIFPFCCSFEIKFKTKWKQEDSVTKYINQGERKFEKKSFWSEKWAWKRNLRLAGKWQLVPFLGLFKIPSPQGQPVGRLVESMTFPRYKSWQSP